VELLGNFAVTKLLFFSATYCMMFCVCGIAGFQDISRLAISGLENFEN
jgi:hypothetical protein